MLADAGARALLSSKLYKETPNYGAYDTITVVNNCNYRVSARISYQPTVRGSNKFEEWSGIPIGDKRTASATSAGRYVYLQFFKTATGSLLDEASNFDNDLCLKVNEYGNVCGWIKHVMPTDKGVDYVSYACL